MALSIGLALPFSSHEMLPQLASAITPHPEGISAWPMLFVTSCCGAISGFHATQSPMMVRCLGKRQHMRREFYGAMVAEGVIALIWATVGLTLRDVLTDYVLLPGSNEPLLSPGEAGGAPLSFAELLRRNPAAAVNAACNTFLGTWGAAIAMLGVVVHPITTGDTAMRTCRLLLADALHLEQKARWKRLALALPIFAAVITLAQVDFSIVWSYCGWATQCLASFMLWSIAVLLRRRARPHWLATLAALCMTTMCVCCILYAPEGAGLSLSVSTAIGFVAAVVCLALLFCRVKGTSTMS